MAQLLKLLSVQCLSVFAFSAFKIAALSDSDLGEGGRKRKSLCNLLRSDGRGLNAADPYWFCGVIAH